LTSGGKGGGGGINLLIDEKFGLIFLSHFKPQILHL
jgi:hypothetical protein